MPPSVAMTSSSPPISAPSHISANRHEGLTSTETHTSIKSRKPNAIDPKRRQRLSQTGQPGRSASTATTNNNETETNRSNSTTDVPTPFPATNPYSMIPYTGGMYGSPYYGGAMMMTGGGGPFSGLYQVLFGVQNIVFSLTQAVQLLGTNQHALQQALDSLMGMIDHGLATFQELRALEAQQKERETEEQRRRRQRLKVLRWSLVVGSSWLLYKIIRRVTSLRTTKGRRRRIPAAGGGTAGSLGHVLPYGAGAGVGGSGSTAWNSMNGGVGSLGLGMLGTSPYGYGGSYGGPSYH